MNSKYYKYYKLLKDTIHTLKMADCVFKALTN